MLRTAVVIFSLALGILSAPRFSDAQQPVKVPRIGVMATHDWPPFEAFRAGLRELGYVEGKNLLIEWRWSEAKNERFPDFAAELIRLKIDVIVVWGTPAAMAAKNATKTIPIVMAATGDPVGMGLIASLARPGGNITGSSALNLELEAKRLELLKEIVPKLSRVAVLWNPAERTHQVFLKETRTAAQALGVQLHPVGVQSPPDFEGAFATMARERADGLIVVPSTVFVFHRVRIADLALKSRLPSAYLHTDHAEAGGLMSYSPNYHDLFRRAATYVDKILKGAKPADLPVEQPMRFELVINLKTAKALGLTIPQSVLIRADTVIQ